MALGLLAPSDLVVVSQKLGDNNVVKIVEVDDKYTDAMKAVGSTFSMDRLAWGSASNLATLENSRQNSASSGMDSPVLPRGGNGGGGQFAKRAPRISSFAHVDSLEDVLA